MTGFATLDPARLLAHDSFLRAIARSLLWDGQAVDDVVQDAYLAALTAAPNGVSPPRAWLGRVVRNLALNWRRGARRRERRERDAARTEAAPSVADILARESVRQSVVAATLGLPAQYRETLLLRYFEDLPSQQIAARLGLPGSTVRTRLQRGLALLRERLDAASDGDRRKWMLALVPIARPAPGTLASACALVALLLPMLAIAGGAAGALALVWLLLETGTAREAPSPLETTEATRGTPTSTLAMTREHEATRTRPAPAGGSAAEGGGPLVHASVRALVVDEREQPVPGVIVVLRLAIESGSQLRPRTGDRSRTDEQGTAHFGRLPYSRYQLLVDPVSLPPGLLAPWNQEHEFSEGRRSDGTAGPRLPEWLHGTSVTVSASTKEAKATLRVVREAKLAGRVVLSNGAPAADLEVRMQYVGDARCARLCADTRSGADGSFTFPRLYPGRYRLVLRSSAATRGIGHPIPRTIELRPAEQLTGIVLVVGAGDRTVTGRVVDQDGRPFAGIEAWAYFKGTFPAGDRGPTWADSLASAQTDPEGRYRFTNLPAEPIGIIVGAGEFNPNAKPGAALLAGWPRELSLDLRDGPLERDAPRLVAFRSRPFALRGEVVVSGKTTRGTPLRISDVEVRIESRDNLPEAAWSRSLEERGYVWFQPVTIAGRDLGRAGSGESEGSGKFAWACETPHVPVLVRLRHPDGFGSWLESTPVEIVPVPNGSREVSLRLP